MTNKMYFPPLCALIMALLTTSLLDAQSVRNGRLVFPSMADFNSRIGLLQEAVEQDQSATVETREGDFFEPYPTLARYEASQAGFTSLRKTALLDEDRQLNRGIDPENLVDFTWLKDPVAATLLNPQQVVQIKDTIYYLANKNITIKIPNGNEAILNAILNGTSPLEFRNQIVIESPENGISEACNAAFEFSNSYYTSLSGAFSFTGSPSNSAMVYHWDFGDGTTSNQKNPQKTYNNQGIYTVRLDIYDVLNDCSATTSKIVFVNQACYAWFNSEPGGTPGNICFFDKSGTINGTIKSWSWNFGDGSISTEQNPCHVFACDKSYTVTLTITTTTNCTRSIFRKVVVNTYACCDNDIDEDETKFTLEVEPGKRKIRGSCEDYQNIFGYNVNAELGHYKKGIFWYRAKANLKVEINGFVYKRDAYHCVCKEMLSVNCESSAFSGHVQCKRSGLGKFRTNKENPWLAHFYEGGILRKTIIAPVNCN